MGVRWFVEELISDLVEGRKGSKEVVDILVEEMSPRRDIASERIREKMPMLIAHALMAVEIRSDIPKHCAELRTLAGQVINDNRVKGKPERFWYDEEDLQDISEGYFEKARLIVREKYRSISFERTGGSSRLEHVGIFFFREWSAPIAEVCGPSPLLES